MSYLFIKKNDVKTFKSFLSGKEIEVGILVSASANVFGADDEVEIFYGNENCDSYKARITRQIKKSLGMGNGDQSLVMLCLVKG